MIFPQAGGRRRARLLCQANTTFQAYQAAICRPAPIQLVPREFFLAGAVLPQGGKQLPRCPAAAWPQLETLLQLYPNARRRRRPALVPGAALEFPDADAALRRIPPRLAASDAIQNSFRPWPGGSARSRGMR